MFKTQKGTKTQTAYFYQNSDPYNYRINEAQHR